MPSSTIGVANSAVREIFLPMALLMKTHAVPLLAISRGEFQFCLIYSYGYIIIYNPAIQLVS